MSHTTASVAERSSQPTRATVSLRTSSSTLGRLDADASFVDKAGVRAHITEATNRQATSGTLH